MKDYFENPELKKETPFSPAIAEKMMKVEQRVSASFGKYFTYNNTGYYKALSKEQKKLFENFLRKKQKNKIFSYSLVIIPLMILSLMNIGLTGNAIKQNFSDSQIGVIETILLIIIILSVALIVYFFIIRKIKEKILERNYKILRDSLVQKRMMRKSK